MTNRPTAIRVLLSNRSNQYDDLLSAAALAKTLKVSLQGVYLEEEDLICAAELSISSDISGWSAKEKEISGDSVQQTLRTHAIHQKRELKRIAEKEKIEYGFDVVRGERISWIFEEIKRNSLLFVAHQNMNRNICNNLNYSNLNKCIAIKYPVKVVFSGSKASIRALEIAIKISLLSQRSLTVLIDADTFEAELNLREQLNNHLYKNLVKRKNINIIAELINTQDQAKSLSEELYMLVYPVDDKEKKKFQLLLKLLQRVNRPLILVR